MAKTALDRADRLFSAGRFGEIISLLEPQVPVYRESPHFYFLLGTSCLHVGDTGGSFTYLKRAQQLSPDNTEIALALAALHVRRSETEKAVALYLGVLERRPGNKAAQRALSVLRKESTPEGLAALIESGRIERLYPRSPRLPPGISGGLIVVGIGLTLLAAVVVLGHPLSRLASQLLSIHVARPQVAAVVLNAADRSHPVTSGGSFRYVLTEEETLATFERAKAYFQQYRDNAALIEINRLLGSNANEGIKEKAGTLKSFVGQPDFRTVRDSPSFQMVAADPYLYDGCSVLWRGMAANVRTQGDHTAFDFLVGYDEKKQLEGIVPAVVVGVPVFVDRALEILATLRSGTGTVQLDVVAIHELLNGK
ncbi:MAG TPA: tetratricopeptide repeat protein [Rectinemataceae bacterium]|nr:tetratricopeptide repeat protein [Rectinemataceae bacterium]